MWSGPLQGLARLTLLSPDLTSLVPYLSSPSPLSSVNLPTLDSKLGFSALLSPFGVSDYLDENAPAYDTPPS